MTENLASVTGGAYAQVMRWIWSTAMLILLLCLKAPAAPKVHVITFGKWNSAQWSAGTGEENEKPVMLRIRALMVDGRVKEYVSGVPHEVTDRLFVVRRVFRVNDSLAEDAAPRWQWQRGGWLLVDRVTGRVAAVSLPEFDTLYSSASWYRDYIAYCAVADDGKKISAMVMQLSRRKPVLKKALSSQAIADDAAPDSACATPVWQRGPVRVTFDAAGSGKWTFAIRGHVVDVVNDVEEEEEGSR